MDEKTLAAMLAETQQPQQKRSPLADFLMSEKDTRPYWETQHRGMVLPLVQSGYNNSVSYGVPGVLGGQGWSTMSDIISGRSVTPDEIGHAAGDVAGAAMTGSFAVVRPSGAIGSGGREAVSGALDMSQAARMQRATEMGFDTSQPARHLSPSLFDSFDTAMIGRNEGGQDSVAGFWFTNPDSKHFTKNDNGKGEYKHRYDVFTRMKNPLVVDDWGGFDDAVNTLAHAKGVNLDSPSAVTDALTSHGYDGIRMAGGLQTVVFDPKNIRKVDAAFDPAMSDSANLLASNPKQSSASASLDHLGKTAMNGSVGSGGLIPDGSFPGVAGLFSAMKQAGVRDVYQMGVPMQGGGLSSPEEERQALANYLMSGM